MLGSGTVVLLFLAVFKLLLHFWLNSHYGYQRDELYFIACGERLAFGYVDVGPLTPWLGRLGRALLGESLFALRFFPAIAGALTVFLTGLLARQLGGGRGAQCLAALSVIIAPAWLMTGNILSLPSFEPLFWVLCANLIVHIFHSRDSRWWVALGAVAGVGLLNKPFLLFFGVGLVLGLLATPHRRYLLDKWLWIGGLAALLMNVPQLLWQHANDWPTLLFLSHMNRDVMSEIPRPVFLAGQVFYMHPINVLVWGAGLVFFFSAAGRQYRILGWIFLTVLTLLLVAQSKIYYLAPAYPALLAGGSVFWERIASSKPWKWVKGALPAAMVLGGAATAPAVLPLLPIEKLDAYVLAATGGLLEDAYEVTGTFHDQFGWEEQVEIIAGVYSGLPEEEKQHCILFAGNFGKAGAADFYGPAHGLPRVYSVHQNYYIWGPPQEPYSTAIVWGVSREQLDLFFAEIEQVATITSEVAIERHVLVYVCREPIVQIKDAWPALRDGAFDN